MNSKRNGFYIYYTSTGKMTEVPIQLIRSNCLTIILTKGYNTTNMDQLLYIVVVAVHFEPSRGRIYFR